MIITISGNAGSGKSTVARLLSKKLGLKHYSIGDLMRGMADERGITLLELNKIAEKNELIDFELDKKLKELGKNNDNFVVDGRLTAFFIPEAKVRVFLSADIEVRAKRILKDEKRQRIQEKSQDLRSTIKNIEMRESSEKKRYWQYYGVDYLDKKLYNCIVDTSNSNPMEVANKIIDFINQLNC